MSMIACLQGSDQEIQKDPEILKYYNQAVLIAVRTKYIWSASKTRPTNATRMTVRKDALLAARCLDGISFTTAVKICI